MAQSAQKEKTLLSDRIPRDTEHERYHPELEEELKECLFCLRRNEMMFDLEVDTDLIEQHIYERQALLCRYRYLLAQARELGLHTILQKYQPMGGLTLFRIGGVCGMPKPLLQGEVSPKATDRLYEEQPILQE